MTEAELMKWLPRLALLSALLMAGVIAYLSLMPGAALPEPSLNDKANHFIAYAALMIAATLGRHHLSLITVGLIVFGFGLLLELAQGLMPYGRSASGLDILANTLGVIAGIWLGAGVERLPAYLSRTDKTGD